jgi:hypothetical protein
MLVFASILRAAAFAGGRSPNMKQGPRRRFGRSRRRALASAPVLFLQRFFLVAATGCGAGPITGTSKMEATGPIDLGDRGIVAHTRCKAGSNAGATVHLLGNGRCRCVRSSRLSRGFWLLALFSLRLSARAALPGTFVGIRGRSKKSISATAMQRMFPMKTVRPWLAMLAAPLLLIGATSQHAAAQDTIKVGILHSLSGTMAISETILKDLMLMQIADQSEGRSARQEDRAGGGRSRLELAAVRGEGARIDQPGQGRRGVRLLDLGVAEIGAAGVRGAQRAPVLSARI